MNDPIEATSVCGDYSSGMYGFLVKGCKKCLLAGLHPDSIRIFLFQEIEKIFGEIKAGSERETQFQPLLLECGIILKLSTNPR